MIRPDGHPTAAKLPQSVFGYDVLALLGEGANSVIYRVREPKGKQEYALKHVIPQTEKDQRLIAMLQNEFELSKLFRHPGLRKSIDLRLRKGLLGMGGVKEAALVMELVDGESLDQARPTHVTDTVDWFLKAASALGALHNLHLVHCDLKPQNLLRTAAGRVKVIDFGQTTRAGTSKDRVQGTPDFIAPEQVKFKTLGFYTDVYSFGATLYWALTERRIPTYFTVKKAERDLIKEQKFPWPHELNENVPPKLSELVMDCIRFSPAYRPANMGQVAERLGAFS